MKIKTSELTGDQLDYAVALADGREFFFTSPAKMLCVWKTCPLTGENETSVQYRPTLTAQGDDIIDREEITTIRCDDRYGTDAKGFTTSKRIPVWAATTGQQSVGEVYGPQGDHWGDMYSVDVTDVVYGATRREAAMRCFVASKLGDEVDLPC